MAEIYLAILVVYHDLTLLLYYLSYFTVSTNQKFRYIIFHQTIYRARLLLLGNATRFFDQSQRSRQTTENEIRDTQE